MRKYSYQSILSAVGRVLDEADAQSFAIRDGENGLHVHALRTDGTPDLKLDFDLADLIELVERNNRTHDAPVYKRGYAHDDDTLRHFLTRHELVGASR
ncbi:MAG TPA: hypothetical protein VKQ30_07290 [Ktedonobacterales bacterium]|nr:hypothetical protein [Ktedonobacterales bacterium]